MYDGGDILLFALSAKHKVSWSSFKQYFEEVRRRSVTTRLNETDYNAIAHRWHALRGLSGLGHIDLWFRTGDIQVVMAPPTLALLPVLGSCRAIVCGARTPGTSEKLKQATAAVGGEVTKSSQAAHSPYAPSRLELRVRDNALIEAVAGMTGMKYMDVPPARLLVGISASLRDYMRELTWSSEPELNWHREDFDTDRLRFRPSGETAPRYRLSRYRNPMTSVWHYRLWRDGESAEISLDWGRYAILAQSPRPILQYDQGKRKAFVPRGAPLPTLLARSLGLCSGYWPEMVDATQADRAKGYYAFRGVPPSIYHAVAAKVDQTSAGTEGNYGRYRRI